MIPFRDFIEKVTITLDETTESFYYCSVYSNITDDLIMESSADDIGKYHELMYIHHSNKGLHKSGFLASDPRAEEARKTKKELEERLGPEKSKEVSDKAKKSADAVKDMIEKNGHKHHGAYWTSKPSDIERLTGIKTSQHENASDAVHKISDESGNIRHLGASLKHLGASAVHAPTGNPGAGQTDKALGTSTQHHLDVADKKIDKEYPHYSHLTQKDKKEASKKDTGYYTRSTDIKQKAVSKVRNDHIEAFNSMPHDKQVHHLRNMIHAHDTPDVPQLVITSHSKGTRIENRAKRYHPNNIAKVETSPKGWNAIEHRIHFKDGTTERWQHRYKFSSGPHSSLKGSFERTDRND